MSKQDQGRKQPEQQASSVISYVWLRDQFNSLHQEHKGIVQKLNELHNEHLLILKRLDESVPEFVTPELQAQVIRAAQLALGIDLKVPDRQSPPATKPKERRK